MCVQHKHFQAEVKSSSNIHKKDKTGRFQIMMVDTVIIPKGLPAAL